MRSNSAWETRFWYFSFILSPRIPDPPLFFKSYFSSLFPSRSIFMLFDFSPLFYVSTYSKRPLMTSGLSFFYIICSFSLTGDRTCSPVSPLPVCSCKDKIPYMAYNHFIFPASVLIVHSNALLQNI